MVPWGTGDPISSGYLDTMVFLTEKPPPLSISEGGGSMSRGKYKNMYIKSAIKTYTGKFCNSTANNLFILILH